MYQVSMVIQQEMRPLPLYTGAALTYFAHHLRALQRRARASASAGASKICVRRAWGTGSAWSGTSATLLLAGLGVTVEVCAHRLRRGDRRRPAAVPCAPLRARRCARSRSLLIEFFRATPIFVQLLWVTYVWPELFGWPNTFFTAGWLALGAAIERLSRRDLPRRHRGRAARPARGGLLGRHVAGRRRSAASCCRRCCSMAAPSIVNQFTVIVKSSTLVSVITVPDLMFQSQKIVNVWYEPIEILTATAAIYIAFVFLVSPSARRSPTLLRRRYGLAAS